MPDYSSAIDYRAHPECYAIGRGEQGVLIVEPYKSELLPLWRYKNVALATAAIAAITQKYGDYRTRSDFVGMDMARKYLQMGYTRARRYAMHKGGRKYDGDSNALPYQLSDPEKVEVAKLYKVAWKAVTDDTIYQQMKVQHHQRAERLCQCRLCISEFSGHIVRGNSSVSKQVVFYREN